MMGRFNEGVPDLGEGYTLVVVTRIVLFEIVSFLFVYHRHCVILLCDKFKFFVLNTWITNSRLQLCLEIKKI